MFIPPDEIDRKSLDLALSKIEGALDPAEVIDGLCDSEMEAFGDWCDLELAGWQTLAAIAFRNNFNTAENVLWGDLPEIEQFDWVLKTWNEFQRVGIAVFMKPNA